MPPAAGKSIRPRGCANTYEEVLADVKQRDYQDTHRAAAPLKQAEDAVLLDTSELNFEQSLDAMKQIIAQKVGVRRQDGTILYSCSRWHGSCSTSGSVSAQRAGTT